MSESMSALLVRRLEVHDAAEAARWDAFVFACPQDSFFHRAGWQTLIREVFHHDTYFLYAEVDGCIQGVLDWMRLPYTHSGLRASAVAMDKVAAKAAFRAAGLPVAPHRLVPVEELAAADPLPRPYVIKPVNEGSSVGVHILRSGDNRRAEIAHGWRFGATALVEEFIPGRELTVGVLGDRALAVTDILADAGEFYDYDSKYAAGGSRHRLPAAVDPAIYAQALEIAVAAHQALGCRGATRADFRYDDTAGEPGRLVLLEVNTQPGLTPTSLLPEQAALAGIGFPALCAWMVEHARHGP